jgi:hypothetical protein
MIIRLMASVGLQEADTTFPENGDTITSWQDQSGNANHFTTVSGFVYDSAEGAVDGADGTGQGFRRTMTGAGDSTLFAVVKTTDVAWIAWQGDATEFAGAAQNANGTAPHISGGSPLYYVDNVLISSATRDTLHDAVSVGSYVVLTITDINDSGWTLFRLLGYSSSGFGYADFCREIRIYSADLTAPQRAQVVARLEYDHGL